MIPRVEDSSPESTLQGSNQHTSPDESSGNSKSKPLENKKAGSGANKTSNGGEKDKKKLVVACVGCRKKKIKCSSDRPACSNCLRLNIPCEYPVIRNRGSRFGYMEMLNRRMQHLEKYINCSTNPDYRPQFVTIHQKPQDPTQLPYTSCGSTRGTVNSGYTNIRSNLNIVFDGTSNPKKLAQAQEAETLITQLGPRLGKELTPPPSDPTPIHPKHNR